VVELSTDSEEIRTVAKEHGLVTEYIRPELLAGDSIGKIDTLKDLLIYSEKKYRQSFNYLLDLDVTSPLRNLNDLKLAFESLKNMPQALNLFSVSPANRSPYFNMVEKNPEGFYSLIKKLPNDVFSRQAAPKAYDLNASFYFYSREFFTLGNKSAITDRSLIYEVPHMCFDLDHPIDFEFISYLMVNNKLDFTL
jgi:CMP-N-acetylneuraminic acid synthetase